VGALALGITILLLAHHLYWRGIGGVWIVIAIGWAVRAWKEPTSKSH
jgi:hypothetical protein